MKAPFKFDMDAAIKAFREGKDMSGQDNTTSIHTLRPLGKTGGDGLCLHAGKGHCCGVIDARKQGGIRFRRAMACPTFGLARDRLCAQLQVLSVVEELRINKKKENRNESPVNMPFHGRNLQPRRVRKRQRQRP